MEKNKFCIKKRSHSNILKFYLYFDCQSAGLSAIRPDCARYMAPDFSYSKGTQIQIYERQMNIHWNKVRNSQKKIQYRYVTSEGYV